MSNPDGQFSIAQCSIKNSSKSDSEFPDTLKHLALRAIHPVHGEVGLINAKIINKPVCQDGFLEIMDAASQELTDFALALFDKYGKLRTELVENEYHRGSGCWGRELDDGIIVYVVSVQVGQQVSTRSNNCSCSRSHAHGRSYHSFDVEA